MISFHFSRYGFWFRVPRLGSGFTVMWGGFVPFSVRNGYLKHIKLGPIRIRRLYPITQDGEAPRKS